MDDLISRQEALKTYHNIVCKGICCADCRAVDRDGNCVVEDWLKELPSVQPEQQWIPCSERLPEIGEHYVSEPCIVYCSNGAYGFAELEENIFGQVGWNCERDDEYHEPLGEVVAWMPLPQPWKGDSDGDIH